MWNFSDFYNTTCCRVPPAKKTMLTLDYKENWNGKLFTDHFNELLPYSAEYQQGTLMEIKLNGESMGIVKIEAIRHLPFCRITDVVSLLNIGRGVQHQAEFLNREHNGGKPMAPDAMISHLVFAYTDRNIPNHAKLMIAFLNSKHQNLEA